MGPLTVIEANEVPLGLFRWFAERNPGSTIAEILGRHHSAESYVEESPDRDLYPSQTWATFATGVPYDKHGIYWYGDPKPAEFPLYWQLAAEHVPVGIVGTLHSSPLQAQGNRPGIRFAIPDAFAADAETMPRSLSPLQAFNLRMTRGNSRAVASALPLAGYLSGAGAVARSVRPRTLARLGGMAGGVALARVNRERLRTGQFLLMADVFSGLVADHDPRLAVFFTNHVAAAMHRYWPATFPEDWDEHPYDQAWIDANADEVPAAMAALDRFLGEQLTYCRATGRRLLVVTSMGQRGGMEVESGGDRVLVVDDPARFASFLGVRAPFEVLHTMVPHLSMRFSDADQAASEHERLRQVRLEGQAMRVDRAGDTVTITYHLLGAGRRLSVAVDGEAPTVEHDPTRCGLRWLPVDAHRAGRHMPFGSVLLANAPGAELPDEPLDLIELAPAILRSLGVPPAPHHGEPTFTLG